MARKKARKKTKSPKKDPTVVEAEKFVVRNADGQVRASFGIHNNCEEMSSNVGLRMFDSNQIKRVDIEVNENDEAGVYLYDHLGDYLLFLSVGCQGHPLYELKDRHGENILETKAGITDSEDFESNLKGFLLVSYIADVAGILHPDKKLKLTHLSEQSGSGDWRESVQETFETSVKQVAGLVTACRQTMDDRQTILFIALGFGCPEANIRVAEVLG